MDASNQNASATTSTGTSSEELFKPPSLTLPDAGGAIHHSGAKLAASPINGTSFRIGRPARQAAGQLVDRGQNGRDCMRVLDLVKFTALMERTSGSPEIVIGLIDGPVIKNHPDLAGAPIREIPGKPSSACIRIGSVACQHGTFVAGILSAQRGSPAPAICPNCTLLVRPIFTETVPADGDAQMPSAKPEELAGAILDCIRAGAHVLNLSAAIAQPSTKTERAQKEALDQAASNQGTLGSTAITSHPWAIPIAAY